MKAKTDIIEIVRHVQEDVAGLTAEERYSMIADQILLFFKEVEKHYFVSGADINDRFCSKCGQYLTNEVHRL